jgi:hypothetical protein
MTEQSEPKNKILEVEDLLQSLAAELGKLKSASQHYDETQENLKAICESIDKISLTHQELTKDIAQFLPIIENNSNENRNNQELIQKTSKETNAIIKKEIEEQSANVEVSLTRTTNDIKKYTDEQIKVIQTEIEIERKTIDESLVKTSNEIRETNRKQVDSLLTQNLNLSRTMQEIRETNHKQVDSLLTQNLNLSRMMQQLRVAITIGLSMEVAIIIILLLL